MTQVLQRFQSGNRESAMDLTLTEIGRENMASVNQIAEQIRSQENEAYSRVSRLHAKVRYWSRVGITGLVLLCVSAVFVVLRLRREGEQERARYLAQLSAERDKLEVEVDRRPLELTDLAQHLQRVGEHERSHLARELHDELGGLLTAAKLDVARVRKRVGAAGRRWPSASSTSSRRWTPASR